MRNEFNKYQFLRDLNEGIKAEIEAGNITDEYQIQEYIDSDLDNAVIYYADCFEICKELNATSFEGWDMGEPKDICQLAYFALYEEVNNELDRQELIELIEQKAEN